MSRTRARILALQVALIALLLTIVYLTLLSPGEEAQLSGVTAPREDEQVVQGPGEGPGDRTDGDGRDNGSGGARAPGDEARDGASGSPSRRSGARAAPAPPPVGEIAPDSPTDDQYADTVARLLGHVGSAP